MPGESLPTRAIVHAAAGLPAFLLPHIYWETALLIALIAVGYNVFILPGTRWGKEWAAGRGLMGVYCYPVTVALLIIAFRGDLIPIAAGWGVLAFADPAATFIGSHWPLRQLPYNRAKSLGGLYGYLSGGLPGVFVLCLYLGPCDIHTALSVALLASAIGGLVESLPLPANDNLTAPLSAAAFIFLAGF